MGEDHGVTNYTERMVPDEAHARIFWEHIARYRFAKDFVSGKRVLDIACGEGYGAAALAKAGAASVTAVDISAEICEHARQKYNLDARAGDAQAIPLPDRSIELIVSFETIEHVDAPANFLGECARILVPEGTANRFNPQSTCLQWLKADKIHSIDSSSTRESSSICSAHGSGPSGFTPSSHNGPLGGVPARLQLNDRPGCVSKASGDYRPGSAP